MLNIEKGYLQMKNSKIYRISGYCLFVGALLFIFHIVLRSVITAGVDPVIFAKESLWVPVSLLGVVGAFLVLLGLPAVYTQIAAIFGLPALIGTALLAMAWMVIGLFLSLYSVLVLPWLAERAPSLIAASAPLPEAFVIAFAIGLVGWLVGGVLLAIPFIRKRVQPTWVGYALVASAVWMIMGNLVIAPSGPASNLAINLLSNLGPVLLLIPLGDLGLRMWAEHEPTSYAGN